MSHVRILPTSESVGSSVRDRDQIERKELARGAWREGNIENALLIIRSVLQEEMSPAVAAACYSAEAGFLADMGDFHGSLESLRKMAPFLEAADLRIQGTFYNARARAYKNLGRIDDAITDYSGAVALWQMCENANYEGAAAINLAELYLMLGDLPQATENIERAITVLPKVSEYLCDAYDTKAKILMAEGKLAKAWGAVQQAIASAGDNARHIRTCEATREQIKDQLLRFVVPFTTMGDLERLRVDIVRYALDVHNGSTVKAAKMLNTSHQRVANVAEAAGLTRKPARKKSILKSLS